MTTIEQGAKGTPEPREGLVWEGKAQRSAVPTGPDEMTRVNMPLPM